jgi:hypothetical protein
MSFYFSTLSMIATLQMSICTKMKTINALLTLLGHQLFCGTGWRADDRQK